MVAISLVSVWFWFVIFLKMAFLVHCSLSHPKRVCTPFLWCCRIQSTLYHCPLLPLSILCACPETYGIYQSDIYSTFNDSSLTFVPLNLKKISRKIQESMISVMFPIFRSQTPRRFGRKSIKKCIGVFAVKKLIHTDSIIRPLTYQI